MIETQRLAGARARAEQRLHRQRDTLRPLGWVVLVAVAAGAFGGDPHPGLHGRALGVTLALGAFAGTLALAIRGRFALLGNAVQAAVIAAMGAAGVALLALQPKGATELAAGAAVWLAVARLPLRPGVVLGVAIAVAEDVVAALPVARPRPFSLRPCSPPCSGWSRTS